MSRNIARLKKSARWSSSELNLWKEQNSEDHHNLIKQRSASTPKSSATKVVKESSRSLSKSKNPMFDDSTSSLPKVGKPRDRTMKSNHTAKSRSSKLASFLRRSLRRSKKNTKKRSIELISQRKNAKIERRSPKVKDSDSSFSWSMPEEEGPTEEDEAGETCFLEFPPDLFKKERTKSESAKTESACGKNSDTSSFEFDMDGFEDFDEFDEDAEDDCDDEDSDFADGVAYFARRDEDDY